jgi:hypothetical protein
VGHRTSEERQAVKLASLIIDRKNIEAAVQHNANDIVPSQTVLLLKYNTILIVELIATRLSWS